MKNYKREGLVKIEFYGAISLLVGLFALIYNHFGHGVHSIFMSYSWGIPFFALIWYACMFAINAKISLISRETLGAAVATLTLASIIEGILVIAGTSSIYVLPMAIIGGLLLIFALIVQLVSLGHKSKSHS